MTPAALLAEIRRCGVIAYRVGDRLRLRPAAAIPPELLLALRAHKHAVLHLVPERAALEAEASKAGGPWRVIVEHCEPVRGPVRLDGCTVAINPARCIERNLIDLERAVAHKNAGRETAYTDLIDQYVTRLAGCGCRVRVEVLA